MGFLGLAGLWAGAWAMASRATVQRFHYFAHFAVVSAVAIAALTWNTIGNWLDFLFPDAGMNEILGTVVLAVLLCALIAGHLSLSSTATRQRRWRIAGLVVAGALAAGGLVAVSMDDSFSDVATFSGMLKPIAAKWIPTATVSEFGDVMKELKEDVDDTVRDVPGDVEKTTKE
jgi:K+-transporting ATPase A subunit